MYRQEIEKLYEQGPIESKNLKLKNESLITQWACNEKSGTAGSVLIFSRIYSLLLDCNTIITFPQK